MIVTVDFKKIQTLTTLSEEKKIQEYIFYGSFVNFILVLLDDEREIVKYPGKLT